MSERRAPGSRSEDRRPGGVPARPGRHQEVSPDALPRLQLLKLAARVQREAMRDKSYRETPVGLAVGAYYRWKRNEWGATQRTLDDYELILARLAIDHADLELADFTPPVGTERLREFIDNRWGERTPRTRAKVISVLRDFFAWAVREKGLVGNPAAAITRPRKRGVERRPFPPGDSAKLIAAQPRRRDRVAVLLLLRLGLRNGELARVQFKHYDGRHLTVFGKGGKVRYLPVVDGELRLELERHILDRGPDPEEYLLYPERFGPEFYGGPVGLIWEDRFRPLSPTAMHRWWRKVVDRPASVPLHAHRPPHGDHGLPAGHRQPQARPGPSRPRRHRHHREHLRAPRHDRPRGRPQDAERGEAVSRWEHICNDGGEHVRDRETGWWLWIFEEPLADPGLEVDVWTAGGPSHGDSPRDIWPHETDDSLPQRLLHGAPYDNRPRRGELAELVDSLRAKAGE